MPLTQGKGRSGARGAGPEGKGRVAVSREAIRRNGHIRTQKMGHHPSAGKAHEGMRFAMREIRPQEQELARKHAYSSSSSPQSSSSWKEVGASGAKISGKAASALRRSIRSSAS